MRHLHRHGRTIENDNFVAPVKLIGFAGIKAQRHIRRSRGFPRRLRPVGSIATHSIVAAIISCKPSTLRAKVTRWHHGLLSRRSRRLQTLETYAL